MVCNECELRSVKPCQGCSSRLTHCKFCQVGPYCVTCQNRDHNNFLRLSANNQRLTTTLDLKESELRVLQSKFGVLEIKTRKLEDRLKLVKKKLTEWNSLLIKYD